MKAVIRSCLFVGTAASALAHSSIRVLPQALRGFHTSSSLRMSGLPKDEQGWMTVLSPSQFAVLREKGTEPPGYSETKEGELEYKLKKELGTKYPQDGAYECVGCGAPLVRACTRRDI